MLLLVIQLCFASLTLLDVFAGKKESRVLHRCFHNISRQKWRQVGCFYHADFIIAAAAPSLIVTLIVQGIGATVLPVISDWGRERLESVGRCLVRRWLVLLLLLWQIQWHKVLIRYYLTRLLHHLTLIWLSESK